jgi:HEXXH motif-containing protein
LVSTHRLAPEALAELAVGHGSRLVLGQLRAAQRSKHLMLLHAIAVKAVDLAGGAPGAAAFQAGYDLLAKVQAERPGIVDRLVSLPQVGAWAHDCIARLRRGQAPDYQFLAPLAAAAAVQAGVGFEIDLPVDEGQVRLPGLGYLSVPAAGPGPAGDGALPPEGSSVRLSSNGECVTVGQFARLRCETLRPAEPGRPGQEAAAASEWWHGTPRVRVAADGQAWDALLETTESHYRALPFPASPALAAGDHGRWQECIQAAWTVLVRQGRWQLDAFADAVSVIVPLARKAGSDFISGTSPAAFGTIATSWPPDPVAMAEMLIHEFQHLKLSALMDIVPLVARGGGKALGYASWRPDPRPAAALLQGMYAHLAVARFWDTQRGITVDPDDQFHAHMLYERWRRTITPTADTLLAMPGCLTPEGTQFVQALKAEGQLLESGAAPPEASELALETAFDHWLTWQISHLELDQAAVARTATAYLSGQPADQQAVPEGRIRPNTRQVAPTPRGQLLGMRRSGPGRLGELCAPHQHQLSRADELLLDGGNSEAAEAYRHDIMAEAGSSPQSWVGLAVAASRTGAPELRAAFAARLPLMYELHQYLAAQGTARDPLDLAAWLA